MDLTALQHSPFLQSLGWAIANSLWQAAVLWLAYILIIGVYRSASAKFKNTLSTILMMGVFVWFCITLFAKYYSIESSGLVLVEYYETNTSVAAHYNWTELFDKMKATLPYLSAAYLLLLLFLSFRLINVYRFTSFIKSNGLQKPAIEWKLFTEKVARHMGIARKIRIWVSHHIDVPATIGFIKPVILIPLASVNQLTISQLEAIILHELSHIKRNDYLINLFISIIETILFFNPFVVLLGKIIKRERENCCDDFVIQYQYDRHAYASALLSLEQYRNINLKLAIGATSGKKQLFQRIKRIMEINSKSNFNYGQKLAALLLITGVICSVAWLSPESKQNKKIQAEKLKEKVILDKKITTIEKPASLFTNLAMDVAMNKLTNTASKPAAKKTNHIQQELKEFQALSKEEIAASEFRRQNQLLLESQKAVLLKKMAKLNPNRYFVVRSGTAVNYFEQAMAPYKTTTTATSDGKQKTLKVFDLQKLQAEMEKAQFSFTFDCDIQETMKLAQTLPLLKTAPVPLSRVKTDVHERSRQEAQGSGSTTVRTPRVYSTTLPSNNNCRCPDSAVNTEMMASKMRHLEQGHVWTPVEFSNVTVPAMAYGFSFEKQKEKSRKEPVSRTELAEGRQTPGNTVVSGIRYRLVRANDDKVTVYLTKSSAPETENVKVEYKNGMVYINGKELKLPNHELEASYYINGKKLLNNKVKETDNDNDNE